MTCLHQCYSIGITKVQAKPLHLEQKTADLKSDRFPKTPVLKSLLRLNSVWITFCCNILIFSVEFPLLLVHDIQDSKSFFQKKNQELIIS